MTVSDEELLVASVGDEEAFAAFYRRNARPLAGFFMRRTGDGERLIDRLGSIGGRGFRCRRSASTARGSLVWTDWPERADAARTIQRRPATMRDAIATKRSRRLMLVAVGLLAAAAVLPLLVPPSAVAWELLPLEARLALEATEISSAKVCGASECREVSDPEAATALAVGPRPRPGVRTRPPYARAALVQQHAHDPRRERRRGAPRLRHRGALRRADARGGRGRVVVWVTLPRESKEAYAKLTAGLTPRPARTLPGVGEDTLPVARVDEVVEFPSAATPAPASDGSNVWIVALGGGVLAALMAGLLLTIRHRRASTPPAAPAAPG